MVSVVGLVGVRAGDQSLAAEPGLCHESPEGGGVAIGHGLHEGKCLAGAPVNAIKNGPPFGASDAEAGALMEDLGRRAVPEAAARAGVGFVTESLEQGARGEQISGRVLGQVVAEWADDAANVIEEQLWGGRRQDLDEDLRQAPGGNAGLALQAQERKDLLRATNQGTRHLPVV